MILGIVKSLCLLIFCFAALSYSIAPSSYNYYKITNRKNTQKFLRVCYYSFGDPEPSKINGTLCTHIIKGFSSVQNGKLNPGSSEEVERCIQTANLKIAYPHLKIMLSVGGGGNDGGFSNAVQSQHHRAKLIYSILEFLVMYNFDGLDIDWEFPVWNDFVKEDKQNLVLFLRDFKKISYSSHNRDFILSVAVAGPRNIIDVSYDIPGIAKFVDFINLMSYDYHDFTYYTPFTAHNSPLFNRSVEQGYFSTLNTAWSSSYWQKMGMPLKKIMVGMPTYGHTYKLLNTTINGLDAPATGYGMGGGSVSFPQVCDFLKNGSTRVFDSESKVPYTYYGYDWISYDDNVSTAIKAQWIKLKDFGGVMTFDLNSDDWQGMCDGKTRFPLHQILYSILADN